MKKKKYIVALLLILIGGFFYEGAFADEIDEEILLHRIMSTEKVKKSMNNRGEEIIVFKTDEYINKKSIIPKKKAEIYGGMILLVEAKIRDGDGAKACLNGKEYEMVLVDEKKSENEEKISYLKYRAFIKIEKTEKVKSLGRVSVELEKRGETIYGGEVIVKPYKEVNYDILIDECSSKIYDGNDTSYIPLINRGAFPMDTLLEVKGEIRVDDKEYYILKSLDRIKKEECMEVKRVLNITEDKNEIRDIWLEEDERFTTLKIKEDYKGEFNLSFLGSFFKDYKNKNFKVIVGKSDNAKIRFIDGSLKGFKKIKGEENSLIEIIKKEKETLNIKFKDTYYGCSSFYDKDGILNIRFKKKIKNLKEAKIIIDPGHGMTNKGIFDPGALGFYGITEHKMNVNIAKILEAKLKNSGAEVIRLRTSEKIYNLKDRQKRVYIEDADMFISLHHNSGGKDMIQTETYYNSEFSKDLAKNINNEIVKTYKEDIFKKNNESYNGGGKWDYYTVLLDGYVPSVLVEVGYINNLESFNKIAKEENVWVLGNSIYKGIKKYILEK
ncbi:MAG: N-acetylmuramoyl-L-alanine amidase family protein [Clostridium sp.]|uniref:N-acetylmuramoyl-L-alanine amidase family protein n=1 Tax=Clostridium sp. TaxID=1506 RepID=UPI003EE66FA0